MNAARNPVKKAAVRPFTVLLCLLGVLGLAACGSDDPPSAATPSDAGSTATAAPAPASEASTASTDPSPTPPSRGIRLITADSEYGRMLYDAGGQPIYLFTAESGDRPDCYEECAEDWPPVLTEGAPRASEGVRPALLGTTERADGTTQVTYAGHPLYYYAHEGKYEVLCHDVEEYGGTWLVVQPDGAPAPS